jgi:hypothetical protein
MNFVERRRFLWILFIAGLALLAVVASATTLARLTFDDMARKADAVARVRCLAARSYLKSGEIWTETQFAVEEQGKGTLPPIISVRAPGGNVGHLHARVEEAPVFRPGEESYLFLWGKQSPFQILGWSQGTFRIGRDRDVGEIVTQESAAAPVFDPTAKQFGRGGIRNMPVAAFQIKLRKALEAAER